MTTVFDAVAIALASVAAVHGAAWCALSAVAIRRPRARGGATRAWRFVVFVPAHDEEAGIAATVHSLRADAYMPEPEVIVIADNCSDETAKAATDAGATVFVRSDAARRGKSFALDHGLRLRGAMPEPPDAYVVVDADTAVEPGFFAAIASRLDAGATVVQGRYEVSDASAPVARLRSLAFALVHYARPLGADRLGLGCGLKGNGMAFRREAVAGGLAGTGIAEDASATLALVRAGHAVAFEQRAVVRGEMAASYRTASVQDRRWEGGRLALMPSALVAGSGALARGRWRAAGSAFDVAALPLTIVGAAAALALLLGFAGVGSLALAAAAAGSVVAYPLLGWTAARVPLREMAILLHAPRFAVYKLATLASLALRGAPRTWERTEREARP